ncbi:MAG TPA: circularly permuted type 2 ATP-grasp protein [Lacunisphaera sp.]|nr:circularly permuted type 2 ATP-grasp protein [Lacunisphaera sp.]
MSAPPFSAHSVLHGYTGKGARYDECVDAAGRLRPAWAQFFNLLSGHQAATLQAATDASHRAIVEQDVSMNVYRGEQAGSQLWPLDVLPMLIAADEWQALAAGLRQRAHLFNELLLDLYGAQKMLHGGLLPAALAMHNPHFLRACVGLGRVNPVWLHTFAVDVARSSDGRWWVIEDRLDAPSGLGYSLQNRIITRQALPEVFQRAPVQRLYQFFHDYRASLEAFAPASDEPRIVLLSPGTANETYFEQAYLSNYLGYTLVEGEDLTTRNRKVFLRTVGGLQQVDVLLRRLDSDFCDPLELDSTSLLGVPGLIHAAHSGSVALANQPGCRALETPALLAFLQPLCRHVLGEDLLLPNAATWWCGQDGPRDYVLDHLANLVIKPTFRTRAFPPTRYGAWMGKAARAGLADDIRANPGNWCAQERVFHSTTPGWHEGKLRPMPFITRLYLTWHDGDYVVMPGGLTRCNPRGEDMIVSLQQGSVSKDTWVLHEGEPAAPPALVTPRPAEALRHPSATPSRTANNFFWLGRYLDRAGALARRLEQLESLLRDEIALLDPTVPRDTLALIFRMQDLGAPAEVSLDQLAAQARKAADDAGHASSLAANVASLVRLLEALKSRLPHEAWQMIRHLRQRRKAGDTVACAWLRQHLTALEGLTLETMPHDTGWHFLQLGRRLERAGQLLNLLQALLPAAPGQAVTEFRLQTLLHLADALFTYRHAYHGAVDTTALLDWLVISADNPRSLRYQADQIGHHLDQLPAEMAPRAVATLRLQTLRVLGQVRLADAARLSTHPEEMAQLFRDQQSHLARLSDELNQIYFSHAESR